MHNEEKDELILRLTLKNKYKWIAVLIVAVGFIGTVWATYNAHTKPPDSFKTKGWAFTYLFGPFFSYVLLLGTIYVINEGCIEIYNSKIIQKVFVKWLPPFERVIYFRPNEMKFKVIYEGNGYYLIAFYNSDKDFKIFLFLRRIFHGALYKKVIYISINPSLKLFGLFYLYKYEKSGLLKLIDILIENCKSENDKEILEKLRKEVLAWKDK
jgi:hypothetical protein